MKYWAKPDEMLISSVNDGPGPQDPFKTEYVPRKYKKDIAEHIQNINPFKSEEAEGVSGTVMHTNPRWTEMVHKLSSTKSIYEDDPNMRESLLKYEQLPLPSSFNQSGVFQDPLEQWKTKYDY